MIRTHEPVRTALFVLLTTSACAPQGQDDAEQLRHTRLALDATRHPQTTRAGVSGWVSPEAVDAFALVSIIGDTDPVARALSRSHFDNCYWEEGRDWILQKRHEAVASGLQYGQSGADADRTAFFDAFGYVLHAAEDFYAHSNWVETHEAGMLANFSDPGAAAPTGWVSGTYENPGDTGPDAGAGHCPPGTPTHSEMNKDGPGPGVNSVAFMDASLAVTLELQKLIGALRAASPSTGDATLAKLGFLAPAPAQTTLRSDATRSLELAGAREGQFTPALFCRPGTFANGFGQRVEPPRGASDDTALNAIVLQCADRNGTFVERLSGWEGVLGEWSSSSTCAAGDFLNRGEMKLEAPQGSGDESAANAARFWCGDGAQIVASNDGSLGTWNGQFACGTGEAVCGVEVAYQAPQGGADDVGMTGMRIHCCTLDNGAGGSSGGTDAGEPEDGSTTDAAVGSDDSATGGTGGSAGSSDGGEPEDGSTTDAAVGSDDSATGGSGGSAGSSDAGEPEGGSATDAAVGSDDSATGGSGGSAGSSDAGEPEDGSTTDAAVGSDDSATGGSGGSAGSSDAGEPEDGGATDVAAESDGSAMGDTTDSGDATTCGAGGLATCDPSGLVGGSDARGSRGGAAGTSSAAPGDTGATGGADGSGMGGTAGSSSSDSSGQDDAARADGRGCGCRSAGDTNQPSNSRVLLGLGIAAIAVARRSRRRDPARRN